jgi:hypothetical protein
MDTFGFKLYRNPEAADEEKDLGGHNYGPEINQLLQDVAGGPITDFYNATVKGTPIRLELHEDGPTFFGIDIGQVIDFMRICGPLVVAWIGYKRATRTVKIEYKGFKFEGNPDQKNIPKIFDFLKSQETI